MTYQPKMQHTVLNTGLTEYKS